jgi:hypothetical protein
MPASATPVTFTGSSGNRSASADFSIVGGNLQVVLTNTSLFDVTVPVEVLTAVFFDLVSNPTLSRVSALLASGSTVSFGSSNGGDVGGEWAYKAGLGSSSPATQGISSVGLSLFGPGDRFNPLSNLQGPASPDGLQYGITSAGDNLGTGNAPVTGGNALIQDSVVFTLSGLPGGFDPSTAVSNVSFQYGTALTEPNIPGCRDCTHVVPEPSTWIMLVTGTLCLLGYGWSRRQAHQDAGTSI